MTIINTTTGLGYATVSEAITASSAGDTIAIPAGLYVEAFPSITHSLTIEGVGGFAHLRTPDPVPPNGRGILWVPLNAGADLTVKNLELSGARAAGANGAGIGFEVGNRNLSIISSWLHDNEDGVLAGSGPGSTVTVTRSEFNNNGLAASNPRYGLSHNLYLNNFDLVTITDSYFHDALGGHEIKSRALRTVITGNRIQDGPTADTSYSIDLPNGGEGIITNNVIEQGAGSINRFSIHFGGDATPGAGTSYPNSALLVADNLMINNRVGGGTAIYNHSLDGSGQSFGATVTGNTAWNFDQFYRDRFNAPVGPNDTITGNTLLTGIAPALDTSHPWDTPPSLDTLEPASGAALGIALFAIAALRRRKQKERQHERQCIAFSPIGARAGDGGGVAGPG